MSPHAKQRLLPRIPIQNSNVLCQNIKEALLLEYDSDNMGDLDDDDIGGDLGILTMVNLKKLMIIFVSLPIMRSYILGVQNGGQ